VTGLSAKSQDTQLAHAAPPFNVQIFKPRAARPGKDRLVAGGRVTLTHRCDDGEPPMYHLRDGEALRAEF
jgi:hypothetical protein